MRRIASLLFLLVLGVPAFGGTSAVTATITDGDAQTWNNGTFQVTFVPVIGTDPSKYNVNGVPFTQSFSGTMNGSGVLTVTLTDLSTISPTGGQWRFNLCPNASAACSGVVTNAVVGATPNLSSQLSTGLSGPRFPAGTSSYGYLDLEVTPTPSPGGTYFNVTSSTLRIWNGSAWGISTPGGATLLGWHRQGTVIPPLNSVDQFATQEASVINDTATGKAVPVTAQILTTATAPVFAATFSCGFTTEGICYAESTDFINWIRFTTNPMTNLSNHSGSCVLVNGSNLEMYTGSPSNGAGGETQIDQYTSTLANPTSWTLAHSAVLTLGTAGAWDSQNFGNCGVRIEGTTRYMLYEARKSGGAWSVGGASSTNGGVTWTKDPGNPFLSGRGGPRSFLKFNGTYYVWLHSAPTGTGIPSDIFEYSAPAWNGPYTALNGGTCVLCRQTADEGVNSTTGQAADPNVVEFNGATYMTYEGNPNGNLTGFHVKLAVADAPIAIVAPTAPVVVEPTAWDSTNPGAYLGQPGKFSSGISFESFNFNTTTDVGNLGLNCHVQTDNATPIRENTGAGGFCLQMNAGATSNGNLLLARPINTTGTLSNIYVAADDTNGNIFNTVGSYFGTNVQANTDPTHNLTCSTSTVTYTFTGRYAHHPVCMCSDETTAGGVKVTYNTTVSATYTCPGASDVIDCMCIGRDLNP